MGRDGNDICINSLCGKGGIIVYIRPMSMSTDPFLKKKSNDLGKTFGTEKPALAEAPG